MLFFSRWYFTPCSSVIDKICSKEKNMWRHTEEKCENENVKKVHMWNIENIEKNVKHGENIRKWRKSHEKKSVSTQQHKKCEKWNQCE